MSFANKESFMPSFTICLLCIYFSCLTALARISSIMFKAVRGDILSLFLILKGSKFLPVSMMYVFCTYSLSTWGSSPLFQVCWEYFYHGRMLDFATFFFAPINIIMWFYFFSLLMWWIKLLDFSNVEPDLHTWDKSYLISFDLHIHCWIRFANILLRFFTSMFISDIDL